MVNKTLHYVAVILGMIFLTGCTPKTVVRVETHLLVPPQYFLLPVNVTPPPMIDNFLTLTADEKEKQLIDAYVKQTKNILSCNVQLSNLSVWTQEQRALYPPSPTQKE